MASKVTTPTRRRQTACANQICSRTMRKSVSRMERCRDRRETSTAQIVASQWSIRCHHGIALRESASHKKRRRENITKPIRLYELLLENGPLARKNKEL